MESYQPLREENSKLDQQQFDPQHQQFVVPQQQPYMIYNPHVIPQNQGLPQQPVFMYPPVPNNTPTNTVTTTVVENPVDAEKMKQDENNSLIFLVLGFFIGMCWLVSYILYRNSPSSVARRNAKIGLILFVAVLVLTFVSLGAFFFIFFMVVAAGPAYSM
ncbi:hypothetical protein ABK040_009746 [Willaertia magna]